MATNAQAGRGAGAVPVTQPHPQRGQTPGVWGRRVRALLSYALLFLLALAFFYPFLLATTTSLKSLPDIAANPAQLIPEQWVLEGYLRMQNFNVQRWMFNRRSSPSP